MALQVFDGGVELLELAKGMGPKAAHLLTQRGVFWGGAGAEEVGGFLTEGVDGRCHGRILVL